MANDAEGRESRKAPRHGVLYLHGAGMPEDQKTVIGDPLATIANGLIDAFTSDEFLRTRYRLVTKAREKERGLAGLDLEVFCRGPETQPDEKLCTLRLRDVLWKPTMRKRGLGDYIPLLWLWAMAFQSHATRIAKLEELNRKGSGDSDKDTFGALEEESSDSRHWNDLKGRIALALAGFLSTVIVAFLVGEIAKWLNPTWSGESLEFKQIWQITTSIICTSVVAAVLLCLLAIREYADRTSNQPHGHLHMFAVILTTAWLALFLVPFLLVVYYLDRVVTLLGIIVGAVAAVQIVLRIPVWWERVAFLFLVAAGIWLATIISSKLLGSHTMLRWSKKDMQSQLANCMTTLLVTGGAPLIIAFILLLEALSVLPLVGDSLKSLATRISESGLWENLKDIHMFLTDSSRAAVARGCIEKEIAQLAQEVDHIHIFSHSLGTVVAYETLVHIGRGDGITIKKNDPVYRKLKSLVTFGSPLNKIRTLANKTVDERPVQTDFDYTRFDGNVVLDGPAGFRWVNFYSFQDIASDVLTLYARDSDPIRPHEFAVASADDIITAHGAYWTDRGFWNTTLQAMGILCPGGDLTHIEKLAGPNGDRRLLQAMREEGILTLEQFDSRFNEQGDSEPLAKLTGGIRQRSLIVSILRNGMPPERLPACALSLLARPEWFRRPELVKQARLEWIDYSQGGYNAWWPGMKQVAKLLSRRRFSGRDDIWAITLGSTIYIRMSDQYAPHTAVGLALLAHELKHVEQFEREGIPKFLWKYVTGYRAGGGYGRSIPFETEAYTFAEQVCEHLSREFAANRGVCPCVEVDDDHVADENFVKTKPEPLV